MHRSYGQAMGCLLWGPCSDVMHQPEVELAGVTPCIALMDEPCDACCEDHVMMQYIKPTLNSQGTPHVSPLRTSHGVSVVRTMWWCNTSVRSWAHRGPPIYRPYGRAMGCLLWGPCGDVIHQLEVELTEVPLYIALTDEPWGVCCEDHVVM